MKKPKITKQTFFFATSPDGKIQARGKTEKEALKLLEETINGNDKAKETS